MHLAAVYRDRPCSRSWTAKLRRDIVAAIVGDGVTITMKLACGDSAFPKLSFEMACHVVKDLGIPGFDICVFSRQHTYTPTRVIADPAGTAREVKGICDRAGVEVAEVFALLDKDLGKVAINHPDAAVRSATREAFPALLEFASGVGTPGMTIAPGMPWPGVADKDSRARSAEGLQWCAELAKEQGVQVSVEPHVGSIVPTVETTLELVEQAPDVKLTLDYTHFVFQGIAEEDVDALIPYTRHFHARHGGVGLIQAVSSEGTVDYRRIIRALEAGGYPGYFAIEYVWDDWMDTNRVDCISETALMRDLFNEETGAG